MLVVEVVGDHHVADPAIEGRRLAHHVEAAQIGEVARDGAEDLVGGPTERVIDVEDDGAALAQEFQVRQGAQARVEAGRIELAQLDHLGVDIEQVAAGDVA